MQQNKKFPKILDMCCGGKHFYIDKNNPNVLFNDIRICEKGYIKEQPNWECMPDTNYDFTNLPFSDNSFYLIVFDPPHIITGNDGILTKKYGKLDNNARDNIKKGFNEAFRVLKQNGTLIFKWADISISIKEILECSPIKPIMGTITKKGVNNTYFFVFIKD